MSDFEITSVAPLLYARKNRTYQENIRLYFLHLVQYLQANGLTTRVVLEPGQSVHDEAVLMRSDLTDEGYALLRVGLPKWQRALTSGKTSPEDVRIFEKELKRMRA